VSYEKVFGEPLCEPLNSWLTSMDFIVCRTLAPAIWMNGAVIAAISRWRLRFHPDVSVPPLVHADIHPVLALAVQKIASDTNFCTHPFHTNAIHTSAGMAQGVKEGYTHRRR
jgi:hypothetical protein